MANPPRWSLQFLRWYCRKDSLEEIEGNLFELFARDSQQSVHRAQWQFTWQVFKHFRPGFIKAFPLPTSIPLGMYHNYLKTMLRQALRQPLYAVLTLAGLALGLAAALFVLLYLDFELNFDRIHERADRIYRVETDSIVTREAARAVHWQAAPMTLGPYIQQDLPEVEAQTRLYRFFQGETLPLIQGNQRWEVSHAYAADASLGKVFSFVFIYGEGSSALRKPNQVLLSRKVAHRIFGDQNPVGEMLSSEWLHVIPEQSSDYQLRVAGVFEDLPPNVHQPIEVLISASTDPYLDAYYFNRFNASLYLLVKPGSNPKALAEKITGLYDRYLDPSREPVMLRAVHRLVPLAEIHLQATGGRVYLWIFGGIGLLLLLIAVVSYVNLATARAGRRAREVGVRKVMGGVRRQLIGQFLMESLLYTLLALGLAGILVHVFTPVVNRWLDLQLQSQALWTPRLLVTMLALMAGTGVAGGAYPAFFLSAFQPVSVLKSAPARRSSLRKALLALQFAIVVFVVCCASTVHRQLRHLQSKDGGFDAHQVIRLSLDHPQWRSEYRQLKAQLGQRPEILALGSASFLPGMDNMGRRPVSADGAESQEPQFVRFGRMDYGFPAVLGLELVEGRFFDPHFPSDSTHGILVNQTLVELFGLEEPVGQAIRYGGSGNPNFKQIVGVVKDFHQGTWHHQIEPQLFTLGSAPNVMVKLRSPSTTALPMVEIVWREATGGSPFEAHFLTADLQAAYQTDQVRKRLFTLLSGFTLVICLLGLFGLTSYLVSQRVGEISLRRILGARGRDILVLLSQEFAGLVILSAIPGIILAAYFSHQWLDDFAAQVELDLISFAGVVGGVLLLTFMVSGANTWAALRRHPVEGLRQE